MDPRNWWTDPGGRGEPQQVVVDGPWGPGGDPQQMVEDRLPGLEGGRQDLGDAPQI